MSDDVKASIGTKISSSKLQEESAHVKEKITSNSNIELVSEFDWLSYLEENGIEASPEEAFGHVITSLDSGVREGMIVERPLDSSSRQSQTGHINEGDVFWLASIDSVYGPLLKLSWLGDEDLVEIWHDLSKERLYPLGWCQMNKVRLEPPKRVSDMCPMWNLLALQYLEDATFDTISMHFIDGEGVTPLERIKPGMMVSIQDANNCNVTKNVKISLNQGGLLRLEEGNNSPSIQQERTFYSNPRIGQPLPDNENETTADDVKIQKPPRDVIKTKSISQHELVSGDTLEVIYEGQPYKAKIEQVFENASFRLKLHGCKDINEVIWSNIVQLAPCGTFFDQDYDSNAWQWQCMAKLPALETAESLGFAPQQKLMVLYRGREFHPCTILETKMHFLKLQLDTKEENDDNNQIILSVHDTKHFPLSWCQDNTIDFFVPKKILPKESPQVVEEKLLDNENSSSSSTSFKSNKTEQNHQGSWCPPIYFNYKCYSASFLSRARLAGLPKKVGPGSVHLVVREVLNLIIGSSFKSGSVLKRLEVKSMESIKSNFIIEELKGKSRVVNLKANIEIPTKAEQVDKYLREMCQKLSACPNLVSTQIYDEMCPADCHNRPKTDFKDEDMAFAGGVAGHNSNGNGNNNGSSQNMKIPRKKGRKRRHPDALLVENSKAVLGGSSSDEFSEASSSRPSSPTSALSASTSSSRRKRNKEWKSILPKSEIRTRGAKLPNFSLHLKIRPSRKEQRAIENASLRSSIGYSDAYLTKSGAKKGRRELPPAFTINDFPEPPPPIRKIKLNDNPENWTAWDTAKFLFKTDCAHLARFIIEDDIDGQAFMLLNYPTVKEYWKLKTSTAISLCRHIESVILSHYDFVS